jgi:hypothetical protein
MPQTRVDTERPTGPTDESLLFRFQRGQSDAATALYLCAMRNDFAPWCPNSGGRPSCPSRPRGYRSIGVPHIFSSRGGRTLRRSPRG